MQLYRPARNAASQSRCDAISRSRVPRPNDKPEGVRMPPIPLQACMIIRKSQGQSSSVHQVVSRQSVHLAFVVARRVACTCNEHASNCDDVRFCATRTVCGPAITWAGLDFQKCGIITGPTGDFHGLVGSESV
jgi:hypothetical protein